jgi:protein-S-isoprenylcysteine O-methyltransferase Ste14
VVAPPEPSRPSVLRVALAILPLPFIAVVVIPTAILASNGSDWELDGAVRVIAVVVGAAALALGLGLFAATVRLFASIGRGTLAPWDPPRRLVVAGPYRRWRHPMITGVTLALAGLTLIARSTGIAIEVAIFVAVNAVYLPLVEEPALVRRFGDDYVRYTERVPRWLPRLGASGGVDAEPRAGGEGDQRRQRA